MTFMEFNKRLEKCHLDNDTKYLLSHMFEVQIEFSKYLDTMTDLLGKIANRMHGVTQINAGIIKEIKELREHPGVSVKSVRIDDDA